MNRFYRFPHTPHLEWVGAGSPRYDKIMSPHDACILLKTNLIVEEKVDGANLGFSINDNGEFCAQSRGSFLSFDSLVGQWKPLRRWVNDRRAAIAEAIFPDLVIFGEWCYAKHSIKYTNLPDWFLAFDVYDKRKSEFWCTNRRDSLVNSLGLSVVPRYGSGRFSLESLMSMTERSQLSVGPAEGVYVRHEEGGRLLSRAKLVREDFRQSIVGHWTKRPVEANLLAQER